MPRLVPQRPEPQRPPRVLAHFDPGADGFIVVDLLPDEAHDFVTKCRDKQLSFIPLVSPTTTDDRMPYVASAADSFVYCVRSAGWPFKLAAVFFIY